MKKEENKIIRPETLKEIIFSDDPYTMNWLRGDYPYAQVSCPKALDCKVVQEQHGDEYVTAIYFTNISKKPFFTNVESIGIWFPLEDKYDSSDVCISNRCNTHIFCGGNVSYIMALRMGGAAPHLGMVLLEGSLECYSVERSLLSQSNDRGAFILHPSPMELEPGEVTCLKWKIFSHGGREDFYKKLKTLPRYVHVEANQYVLFEGEMGRLFIQPFFTAKKVLVNGRAPEKTAGGYVLDFKADTLGEMVFDIYADDVHTWCRLLVRPEPGLLAKSRCLFIARNQQYNGRNTQLAGAYLAYDNEEKHIYYDANNDYNGGRERVGMGMLIARFLSSCRRKNSEALLSPEEYRLLEDSLKKYTQYLEREIIHMGTGEVCNDMGLDNSYKRLYNFPWYASYFTELYRLFGEKQSLETACRILRNYYGQGGDTFYAIELPVCMLNQALLDAGMDEERQEMEQYFIKHADKLIENGVHYPASEVNYEQSIVAPAAWILLQVYVLTGKRKYLEEGKRQLKVLEQFNGCAPDYHLYEMAIRHWDGYWFGKRELYGDTLPHYWSALSGNVFALYAQITGDKTYERRAEASLRGVLPLIFPDGSASCAYVYPYSVNGILGAYYDPYANDQDWGMYFYLRGGGAAVKPD